MILLLHALPRASLSLAAILLLPGASPGAAAPQAASPLVPAGSINDALAHGRDAVVLVEKNDAVERYAAGIRSQFKIGSRSLDDRDAMHADLAGADLVFYGTPASVWIAAHAAQLPFRWGDRSLEISGRRFEGAHLRLICAIKSPVDPSRRAALYLAASAADVVNINALFHGPTEWVVGDGDRVLASGSFPAPPLALADLQADLDFLAATARDVHPALLEESAGELADAFATALDEARDRLAAAHAPLAREAFWRIVAPVLASLHDAHSTFVAPLSGERLDLDFEWLAEGPVVRRDTAVLKAGDRILAIGGHRIDALLGLLREVVACENESWLRAQGERLLCDLGVLRALGIAASAPVSVAIERQGPEQSVAVPLAGSVADDAHAAPWVRFDLDQKHDLGLLTIDRCTVDDTYTKTLAAFFAGVREKGIGRIAVDLRANGGGNSQVTDEFLRYLDVEDYLSFGGSVRGSPQAAQQRGAPDHGCETHPPSRRENRRVAAPFKGELDVIVGKHTFSSGNWFALVVQDNRLGKIVGEPTGNRPSSFGDVLSFALPRSGLAFGLSYKQWVRPDPSRDPADQLVPDVIVARTRANVRDGSDPVLEHLRRPAR